MIFWAGILVGGLFVWLAVKIGFYEMWAMLFNIVISVYLAIFLGPAIVNIIPGAGDSIFSDALAMICIGIVAFLILHCISYTFITGQFTVSFPRLLDSLGAAFLGFLAGFLVWSFVGLLICITPISQNTFVKGIGLGSHFQQTGMPYICRWCNLVNKAVASQDNKITCEETIDALLKSAEKEAGDEAGKPADATSEAGAD